VLPWHISVSIVADNGPSDVYRRGPVPKTCVKFNKKPAVKCFKFMLTQTGAMFCEIDRLWVGEARGPKIDHNPPPTPPPRGGFRLGTVRKSVSKIKESLVDGVFGWIPRTHGVPTGECLHANNFFFLLTSSLYTAWRLFVGSCDRAWSPGNFTFDPGAELVKILRRN
jgi:hypothetical protein